MNIKTDEEFSQLIKSQLESCTNAINKNAKDTKLLVFSIKLANTLVDLNERSQNDKRMY